MSDKLQLKNEAEGEGMPDNPFSTRRPKDALAGLSSGLKNAGKGVGLGVAGLIAAPIVGAQQEGAAGFAKGLVAGAVGAIALPLAGAVTGIAQISRGIFNTPEAIIESNDGRVWDTEKRVWFTYDLKKEAADVLSISEEDYVKSLEEEGGASSGQDSASLLKPAGKVKETEFYDLLGVATNATSKQIKMAYYKKAKQLHPDKNRDDPDAAKKFQAVGAAYQVLSSADLREKYDKGGKDGIEDAPILDSAMFFTMIFGSDKLGKYMGEPWLAMLLSVGQDMDPENPEGLAEVLGSSSKSLLSFKQKRREVQCAVHLAERLNTYVRASLAALELAKESKVTVSQEEERKLQDAFRALLKEDIDELSQSPLACSLLGIIGYIYQEQAKKFLGFEYSFTSGIGLDGFRRYTHSLGTKWKLLASGVKTYRVMKKAQRKMSAAEKKKKRKESVVKTEDSKDDDAVGGEPDSSIEDIAMENISTIIETLWNLNVLDVESTLRKVCAKVLKDGSVSPESRSARAKALLLLGELFLEKAIKSRDGIEQFADKLKDDISAAKRAEKMRKEQEKRAAEGTTGGMPPMTMPTIDDIRQLSIGQLKQLLDQLGVDHSDCIEKEDMVKKLASMLQ